MLTKISEKLREFVSSNKGTPSRKRKHESDVSVGEGGPSPAKRTRQDTPDQAVLSGGERSKLLQFRDWVARKTCAVSENSFIKALSPTRVLSTIRGKMTSQPRQLTPYPQQQRPIPRQYIQQQNVFAKPQPYMAADVREKTNIPQPKFNDSIMSPGGHVAPPRPPRVGSYGFQSQFDPSKRPNYSFARQPNQASEPYSFRAPAQPPNYAQSRINSYGSHGQVSDVRRSMYDKLYGRRRGIERRRHKQAVKESIRIEEKKRYADLLRTYTPAFDVKDRRAVRASDLSAADAVYKSGRKVRPTHTTPRIADSTGTVDLTRETSHEGIKVPYPQIDLTEDDSQETQMQVAKSKEGEDKENDQLYAPPSDKSDIVLSFPRSPTNESLKKSLSKSKYATQEWISDLKDKYSSSRLEQEKIKHLEIKRELMNQNKEEWETQLEQSLRQRLALSQRVPPVIDESFIEIVESEDEDEQEVDIADEFPVLTEEEEDRVDRAFEPEPPQEVLVDGFKLQLTRSDIATLSGLNWLNDEVINFYMNMLMERSTKENFPSVHAFNTFFYPKLMSNGFAGVKRWTKRGNIDIFSKDYILVPVHLGMHWCLSVIDFTKKEVRYYDSMGGQNNACLNALKQYLEDESLDKKKQGYSTSDWSLINVTNIPHQMNGSDCGMFTCKFAEYISRGAEINFSQEHMPYFRRRMVLEILNKTFMT